MQFNSVVLLRVVNQLKVSAWELQLEHKIQFSSTKVKFLLRF